MMSHLAFDYALYVRRLREKGMADVHAEAVVEVIRESQEAAFGLLATREYLNLRLKELELRLQNQLKDLQIRLGGMIVALGGVLIAIRYFG